MRDGSLSHTGDSHPALPPHLLRGEPAEPAPTPLELRAGPLRVTFAEGGLRYLQAGALEIVSQIYGSVRDENWDTVPGRLIEVTTNILQDSFEITFVSEHKRGAIDFVWRGRVVGHPSGALDFSFDGEPRSTFKRNRIGLCVLHPATLAGVSYRAEHVAGTFSSGTFPTDISPHQPLYNLRAFTCEVTPQVEVALRFEGDTFEMEDQRNWTDASFKTYCTPLAEPYPVAVGPGQRVRQRVSLKLSKSTPIPVFRSGAPTVVITSRDAVPLPELGLTAKLYLSEEQLEHLSALHLTHLRLDLDLQGSYARVLEQTTAVATALGVQLELALHLGSDPEAELTTLLEHTRVLAPPVVRWLIVGKGTKCTSRALLDSARGVLCAYRADVPLGGGTDAFFAELNREFPPVQTFDFVSYSVNPQVHAFDNASLTETLPIQGITVDSARKLAGGKPVVVSPITLKMRWNPNATAPAPEENAVREAQLDQRQWSLFNAGWTVSSLKYLAQRGAASLTYFETSGALGVMSGGVETPAAALLPPPGCVYPVYHVFADVGAFSGGQVYLSRSSRPHAVDSLVVERMGKIGVLLANHTPDTLPVDVTGLTGTFCCRLLDETNVLAAMLDPKGFQARTGTTLELPGALLLPPYAYARLEGRA